MSEKLKMSDAVRVTGVSKSRINEMIKRQLINPKKDNNGYVFTDELIGLIT
ncbi:MerR family transcriptional regulator, partial [Bacillus circulans]|nr:MerR family transcriptional regulator [Niallia circulans]